VENPLLFRLGGVIATSVEDAGGDRANDRAANCTRIEKRVLMIAFHYPPCRGSSGLQRTLSFSRYLPVFGWQPIVLTANPKAYPEVGDDQLSDIPCSIFVKRAFALDTGRHFSFHGHYLGWTALPDRWISWLLGAVPLGVKLVQRHKPRLLWSTHPIPTAHLLGFILQRLTGIPWVADFRDPMTEVDPVTQRRFPEEPATWNARRWVERRAIKYCSRAVFVAPTTLRMYTERYPEMPKSHWVSIANGYNEESFVAAEQRATQASSTDACIRLLHSGLLYVTDRDPSAFFTALAKLRETGKISRTSLQVILRAPGNDNYYRQLIQKKNISDVVTLEPAVPYRDALAEMLGVHGLLIFQGQESNANIPAKLYEYLRARRPIFAMVDPDGDTAGVLKAARVGTIVPMNSVERIVEGLIEFIQQVRAGTGATPGHAEVKSHSRVAKTQELAELFDAIIR
jgi:hypothetical protein